MGFPDLKKKTLPEQLACTLLWHPYFLIYTSSLSTHFIKETVSLSSDSLIQPLQRGQIIFSFRNDKQQQHTEPHSLG